MSEVNPESTPENAIAAHNPSFLGELLSLGKLFVGACLIAFGCWRAFVWAVGPDESLFLASRVKAQHAADERAAQKRHEEGVRELKRARQTPEDQARERERLDRELAKSLEQQPQRDKEMYRVERWMELPLIVFAFAFGPGFLWVGKSGVRWPKFK